MQNRGIIKWMAILLGVVVSVILLFIFVGDDMEQRDRDSNISLERCGGVRFVLEIKAVDVIRTNAFNDVEIVSDKLLRDKIESALKKAAQNEDTKAVIDAYLGELSAEDLQAIYGTTNASEIASNLETIISDSVSKMHEVLATRIDLLGVVQPNIQSVAGTNRIMVELPGVKNAEYVSKLLASTANLEFWEVCDASEAAPVIDVLGGEEANTIVRDYLLSENPEAEVSAYPLADLLARNNNGYIIATTEKSNIQRINDYLAIEGVAELLPEHIKLAWSNKSVEGSSKNGTFELYALKGANGAQIPVLDGSGITSARAKCSRYGGFEVSMTMDSETAIEWGNITAANTSRPIAIVLDSYVYSVPRVNGRIDGGQSSITGNFSAQEAEDLANVLMSGQYPAPVTIISSEVVEPLF